MARLSPESTNGFHSPISKEEFTLFPEVAGEAHKIPKRPKIISDEEVAQIIKEGAKLPSGALWILTARLAEVVGRVIQHEAHEAQALIDAVKPEALIGPHI